VNRAGKGTKRVDGVEEIKGDSSKSKKKDGGGVRRR